jgi:hypothetical protein
MASKVEIWNLALSHVGVSKEIAEVDENSKEAAACRRFYDICLDKVLGDFNWPFATKSVALGLITDSSDDEHETDLYTYVYQYPSDCVKARKILSGTRNESRQDRVHFKFVMSDSGSRRIYTDEESAVLEYTARHVDSTYYPADFTMALSYLLASYIGARLTGGDPFQMRKAVLDLYMLEISNAQANAGAEEQPEEPVESEFIRVRE